MTALNPQNQAAGVRLQHDDLLRHPPLLTLNLNCHADSFDRAGLKNGLCVRGDPGRRAGRCGVSANQFLGASCHR